MCAVQEQVQSLAVLTTCPSSDAKTSTPHLQAHWQSHDGQLVCQWLPKSWPIHFP